MPAVKQHAALDAASFIDFNIFGPGDDIPRGQLQHVGSISFHEALTLAVEEIGSFTSSGFGNQQPLPLQRCRVILHHFHIHQRGAGAVGHGHSIPRTNQCIGAWFVYPPQAP